MQPLLLTLLVGMFILGGTLLGIYVKDNAKTIHFTIGLALGVIVALIFCELVPEAYEKLSMGIPWKSIVILMITAIIGILLMNILDSFVPHHEHESTHHHKHKDDTCHNAHLNHIGILATVALALHNLIEGMTLYITAHAELSAGYLLCVGIGLHNIPLGILIAGTLHTRKETIVTSLCLIFSSFVGGLMMHFISGGISDFVVGSLISLTIGMLIYIAFVELLGQILHSENKKVNVVGVITGIFLFFLSIFMS